MVNKNTPAFSIPIENDAMALGLTKREYAAIHAMQGLLAHSNDYASRILLVEKAVTYADLLFEELESNPQHSTPEK